MGYYATFLLIVGALVLALHWRGGNAFGAALRTLGEEERRWRAEADKARVARIERHLRARHRRHIDNLRIAGIRERGPEDR